MLGGISMRFWLWLLAVAPSCIHPAIGHSTFLLRSGNKEGKAAFAPSPAPVAGAPAPSVVVLPASYFYPQAAAAAAGPPLLLSDATIIRGVDELAISESAMESAKADAASLKASQQELVADQVLTTAEEPWEKVRGLVPELKAAELQVQRSAMEARQHRDHAEKVADEFGRIGKEAAERAWQATTGWIAADAAATAEHTATIDKKGDKVAKAVAAAAEPYHLALLRNQKFCAETYSKAKSAQSSYQKLVTDAKKLALEAQVLQASGMSYQALESNTMAQGMMTQAEDMRQWGTKLYNEANTACASANGWVIAEQQAAASAAATTPVNAPMKLPKRYEVAKAFGIAEALEQQAAASATASLRTTPVNAPVNVGYAMAEQVAAASTAAMTPVNAPVNAPVQPQQFQWKRLNVPISAP